MRVSEESLIAVILLVQIMTNYHGNPYVLCHTDPTIPT